MHIDLIRENISQELNENSFDFWGHCLTDTNPGNYGADEWQVNSTFENIFVDIPNRRFTFKEVEFNFTVTLGGSKDGFDEEFYFEVEGSGEFEFINANNIKLKELKLNTYLDLISDDEDNEI